MGMSHVDCNFHFSGCEHETIKEVSSVNTLVTDMCCQVYNFMLHSITALFDKDCSSLIRIHAVFIPFIHTPTTYCCFV